MQQKWHTTSDQCSSFVGSRIGLGHGGNNTWPTIPYVAGASPGNYNFVVSGYSGITAKEVDADIDDIRIYNRELSTTELTALHAWYNYP